MTTTRIDANIRKIARDLFSNLCPDKFSATNRYSQRTLAAMEEARRLSRTPDIKGYVSMEELKKALEK